MGINLTGNYWRYYKSIEYMMEYRIAKGMRIFVFISLALFAVIGIYFLVALFVEHLTANQAGLSVFLGVFMLLFAAWGLMHVLRTRLTIDERAVTLQTGFRTKTILLKDIAGYRIAGYNQIFLVPKSGRRALQIPAGLERTKELREWVRMKFDNTNTLQEQEDTRTILADQQFGQTKDDRWMNLKRAKGIANAGSANGLALLLWVMLYPQPYEWVMIALLIAPWVAVYGTWYSRGLIRLTAKKGSGYPTLLLFILLPVMGLLYAVLRDYSIYDFPARGWMMLAATTLPVAGLCILACAKSIAPEDRKGLIVFFVVVISAVYSFGSIVFINCFYDRSEPEIWRAQVLRKRVSYGTYGTTADFYLELSAWGRFKTGEEVEVPKKVYNDVNNGDSVNIFLRQGKWKIPWYWVTP